MTVMPPKPKKPRTSEIYLWRTRKGWTQKEMCQELGVERTTLHKLEAAKTLPKKYQRAFQNIKDENP